MRGKSQLKQTNTVCIPLDWIVQKKDLLNFICQKWTGNYWIPNPVKLTCTLP